MTGRWPPADLPGLHVDLGHWVARSATWLVLPTADYRCACGYHAEASGDQVPAFVATARRLHIPHCPIEQKDTPDGDHPDRDRDPLRPAEDRP